MGNCAADIANQFFRRSTNTEQHSVTRIMCILPFTLYQQLKMNIKKLCDETEYIIEHYVLMWNAYGRLSSNIHTSSMAHWKDRSQLTTGDNLTFSLALTLKRKSVKVNIFLWGWVL